MTNGIYYYYDTKKNSVVYVGRDNNIDKNKRHRDHIAKCNYDNQSFNSILQNNPDRYEYRIYCEGNFSNEELNDLEIQVIKLFDTHNRKDAFNFTEGGEGIVGFKHSEETRKKMSDALSGENNPMYGKKRSEETRKKISEASNGKRHTYNINKEELEEIAEEINKLENKDEETINQIIEEYKANKKNYATVIKAGIKHGKQNYALKQNGEIIKQSIYKEKLEKEVEEINKKQDKQK